MAPSRAMSVHMTVSTPSSVMREKNSPAVTPELSSQPFTATSPSRKSQPAAILPPYFAAAASRKS